ncbi:hypothetical protein T01_12650 [Trichinella spiralis]|uniref:Uncharacterized protein n=1 Tax=Trichinella spiralis TaxID=6334 RepID=A0A0V1BQ18_TRISP|nr:hypothetical protein T01_12650 [Trichinella spiralis]
MVMTRRFPPQVSRDQLQTLVLPDLAVCRRGFFLPKGLLIAAPKYFYVIFARLAWYVLMKSASLSFDTTHLSTVKKADRLYKIFELTRNLEM